MTGPEGRAACGGRRLPRAAVFGPLALMLAACDDSTAGGPGTGMLRRVDAVVLAPEDAGALPDAETDAAPPPGILFVARDARAAGADGTRDHPYPSPETAFEHAGAGTVVVLLPASDPYPALVGPVPAGVALTGFGRDGVRLSGPVRMVADDSALRSLTVEGGDPAVSVEARAGLENVHIVGATGVGLRAVGAELNLESVEVADAASAGLWLETTHVEGHLVTVVGARGGGVRLTDCTGGMTGVHVADIAMDADGIRGNGVEVEGGEVALAEVAVSGVADRAVRIAQGATSTVDDVRVSGGAQDGLAVLSGARADVRRFDIEGAANVGLTVNEADATLSEGVVRGGGRAGCLFAKTRITLTGVSVEDAPYRGVSLLAAQGELHQLTVRRAGAVGVQVTEPAGPLALTDGLLEDNLEAGLSVFDAEPGRLSARGLVVLRSKPGPEGEGQGVHLYRSAATIEGGEIVGNADSGLLVELSAVSVQGTRVADNAGPGVVAVDPSGEVGLVGVEASGNRGAGVLMIGGTLRSEGLRSSQTRAADDGTADGVELVANASAVMSGDELFDNEGNGLFVFGSAHVTASDLNAHDNGAFGVYTACDDSTATLTGDVELSANGAGPRNACP